MERFTLDAKQVFETIERFNVEPELQNRMAAKFNIEYFECPKKELKSKLNGAKLEKADTFTEDEECVTALYIDDTNRIAYTVILSCEMAFVKKFIFKW